MSRSRIWLLIILGVFLTHSVSAQNSDIFIQRSGDVLAVGLPALTLAPDAWSFLHGDKAPIFKSASAYGLSMGMTYLLKFVVNRTRPNGEPYSFPSGHSTSAFSGATMIQMNHGWKWGAPAYLLAGYVAYSRVKVDKHYVSDVIAGAVIGTGVSYLVCRYWPQRWNEKLSVTANHRTIGFVYSL